MNKKNEVLRLTPKMYCGMQRKKSTIAVFSIQISTFEDCGGKASIESLEFLGKTGKICQILRKQISFFSL